MYLESGFMEHEDQASYHISKPNRVLDFGPSVRIPKNQAPSFIEIPRKPSNKVEINSFKRHLRRYQRKQSNSTSDRIHQLLKELGY